MVIDTEVSKLVTETALDGPSDTVSSSTASPTLSKCATVSTPMMSEEKKSIGIVSDEKVQGPVPVSTPSNLIEGSSLVFD